MSRARRAASSPVQLFPFLAVLMSVMGALILLLLAINRQAAEQAIAAAVSLLVKQTDVEEESLARRRQELDGRVSALRGQLAKSQDAERAVEKHIVHADDTTRARVAHAESARQELEQIRAAREKSEEQIAAIRQQIETIEAAKARLLAEQSSDQAFIPVVHPGANGVARQPIYLECTSDAVVIQPERIAISTAALTNDPRAAEALARAIQALTQFHLSRDAGRNSAAAPPELEPYPLLLVRPGGTSAYYAARQAIEQLELPFGYELIDRDWSLRFPEADPRACAVAMAALRSTVGGARGGAAGARLGAGGGTGSGAVPFLDPVPTGIGRAGATGAMPGFGAGRGSGGSPTAIDATETETKEFPGQRSRDEQLAKSPERENATNGSDSNFDPTTRLQEGSPNTSDAEARRTTTTGAESDESKRPVTGQDSDARRPRRGADGEAAQRNAAAERSADRPSAGADGNAPGERPALAANPRPGGKIAIPRSVIVIVERDRLVVGPRKVVIDNIAATARGELAGRIADELDHEAASWGPPGITFYWEPQLDCRVHSAAVETYYRLRFALAGGSIAVERRLTNENNENLIDELAESRFLKSLDAASGQQPSTLNPQSFLE